MNNYEKTFDFYNISKDDIYIGKISMITYVDLEIVRKLRFTYYKDFSSACKTVTAKRDAVLIRVTEDCYIDIDSIERGLDCVNINRSLNSLPHDNRLLRVGVHNPTAGLLFIREIKKITDLEFEKTDIKTLKLIYKDITK